MQSSYVVRKALQLYLSTGISHLVLIDRICLLSNLHKLKDNTFGLPITDLNVKHWQDKGQFDDPKKEFEKNNTPFWHKANLPDSVKKYCVIEGWAMYTLYTLNQSTEIGGS
ncbi:hypothetical protein BD770DRAFT_428751 [Pilaira anomala]|nr:hypothetical protein BD770DRAFT_428751 [Pilaira anomala]